MAARVLVRSVMVAAWAMLAAACTVAPPQPRATSDAHLSPAQTPPASARIPAPV